MINISHKKKFFITISIALVFFLFALFFNNIKDQSAYGIFAFHTALIGLLTGFAFIFRFPLIKNRFYFLLGFIFIINGLADLFQAFLTLEIINFNKISILINNTHIASIMLTNIFLLLAIFNQRIFEKTPCCVAPN